MMLRVRRGVFLLIALFVLPGCNRHRKAAEIAYVSVPSAVLRDRVATVYNKVGMVKNADKVQILERERRFVRIKTDGGLEGWIEQRYLVPQEVFDSFQKLGQQEQGDPLQATGTTRNDTNIHLEPGRESDHLYQLVQGTKISLFKRSTAEKVLPGAAPKTSEGASSSPALREDWWLIRDPQAHVGWVLGRMVDVDAPLEIAQYAEGQRIVAFFVLDQVTDGAKKVPQYLVALTEPKDGMAFDFNQIRVFTWNVKRHRYETAYRERNLDGVLPITVSQEGFDKEGTLPIFIVRVKDDSGNVSERKYKLNTPIVRRVLAPGEQPVKSTPRRRAR
ncbi:MAG TPA: SH3 domain-containing protein [Terriglobales bacterium]|nr:SH3 domain-containing protein [Terriglobales bacterium]